MYKNKYLLIKYFYVNNQHVVFVLVEIINWLIPDIPKEVQDQIERENIITQRCLWEIKSESIL